MNYVDPASKGCGHGGHVGGLWTSTGVILVLFILLVIVFSGCFC
ncbi:sporulation protein YjcZ [Paenibacillus sp. MMS18-CY102]|nr:sporulation protein YjcZ [Paenibacillus sp. MMS18-CY102]MWC29537.1 sporulation protein YjcZ [Paenibacillus sp. MMS18-CY102]